MFSRQVCVFLIAALDYEANGHFFVGAEFLIPCTWWWRYFGVSGCFGILCWWWGNLLLIFLSLFPIFVTDYPYVHLSIFVLCISTAVSVICCCRYFTSILYYLESIIRFFNVCTILLSFRCGGESFKNFIIIFHCHYHCFQSHSKW